MLIRDLARLKTVGCYNQIYFKTKQGFSPNDADQSPVDFFFKLRNAKEDCLLCSATSGGAITFKGAIPVADEELTATMESDVTADWLEAIGGSTLREHVFRVFSKDLESVTLSDLRQRITDNLANLKREAQQNTDLGRVEVSCTFTGQSGQWNSGQRSPQYTGYGANSRPNNNRGFAGYSEGD